MNNLDRMELNVRRLHELYQSWPTGLGNFSDVRLELYKLFEEARQAFGEELVKEKLK